MFRRLRDRLRALARRFWVEVFTLSALSVLAVFLLWPFIVHTVPPGHLGVLWKRFYNGTQTAPEDIRQSGVRLTWPWDRLYIYDARLQRIDASVKGLSTKGLDVSVTVYSRFVIDQTSVGYLHKNIGENYRQTLLEPALRAILLSFISEHRAEDLYSEDRAQIESLILGDLRAALGRVANNSNFDGTYFAVEDVLIEEIQLPEFVLEAIRNKERIRQVSEAYEHRLVVEDRERERKRIEAEGIRLFQEIVAPGITPSYLRWRGIEATVRLSESPNTKIVVIGSGGDGLPIILNADPAGASPGLPGDGATGLGPLNEPVPEDGSIASELDDILLNLPTPMADMPNGASPLTDGENPTPNQQPAPPASP